MAVRPVIEIDVNDGAFKRFYSLFETYKADLENMPQSWQAIEAAMADTGKSFESRALSGREALALAATQAEIIAEAVGKATRAQNELGEATRRSESRMHGLAKAASNVGKGISTVGGWIVRLGALGGLGAVFSGLGIGELASSAFGRYRAAGGLGVSPGLLSSFEVNAQQFLGTSALQSAVQSQFDIQKIWAYRALGIHGNPATQSPVDLAFASLRSAAQAFQRYQGAGNAGVFKYSKEYRAYEELGGSLPDVIRAAQPGGIAALNAAQVATYRDAAAMDLHARKMAQLKIEFDRLGQVVETSLINRLEPLAPEIGRLADDVGNAISAFLKSKDFEKAVDAAAGALRNMLNFLEHVDWVKLGAELDGLISKMGWLVPKKGPQKNDWPGEFLWGPLLDKGDAVLHNALVGSGMAVKNYFFGETPAEKAIKSAFGTAIKAITTTAKTLGVDPLLALASASVESKFNPRAVGDHKSSFGLFQLHRGGELGSMSVKDAFDPWKNARVALPYFAQVARAHPNWSPGQIAAAAQRPKDPSGYAKLVNQAYMQLARGVEAEVVRTVDADIHKHGKDWMRYLPADIKAFVSQAHLSKRQQTSTDISAINTALRRALNARTATKPTHVVITNSTPARVAVSVNATK